MRHRGGARSEEGPQEWDDNRKQSHRSLSNSRAPARIERVLAKAQKVLLDCVWSARPSEGD
jgi:hypothetical protein